MAKQQPTPLDDIKIETFYPSEIVTIDDLKPWPRNYNEHPDEQLLAVGQSLSDFGQFKNVVIWRRPGDTVDYIVAGHGLIESATKNGWKQIEAKRLPADWDEATVESVLVADNNLPKLSKVNEEKLADLLVLIRQSQPARLAATGYDSEKLDAMLRDMDRLGDPGADAEPQISKAEELQKKWNVQMGDMFACGEHRIICGDCTQRAVVERLMGGGKAALVVTDPPYGVEYADKNKFLNSISPGNRIQTEIAGDHGSKSDIQAMWKSAFCEMSNVMSPGAVVYCFMPQGGDQMMMMMMMMGAGIEPRHELIWLKNNHVLGRSDYNYKHEPILYAWKEGGHKFYGDFQTSVIECNKPHKSDMHPTMKPVELIEKLISNSSRAGEIIYEPFSGSGTAIVSCQNLSRKCRAVEIDPGYVAVAIQRWVDVTNGQPQLITP